MNDITDKTIGDIMTRARRIDTRLGHFMRWCGYDPSREVAAELKSLVLVDADNALHATTPGVSLGDVVQAMYYYKLEGDVPLHINGVQVGTFNVTKNLVDRDAHKSRTGNLN